MNKDEVKILLQISTDVASIKTRLNTGDNCFDRIDKKLEVIHTQMDDYGTTLNAHLVRHKTIGKMTKIICTVVGAFAAGYKLVISYFL